MTAATPAPNRLLGAILAPLSRHYDDPTTVEVRMNRPRALVADRRGAGKRVVADDALTRAAVETVAVSLANSRGLRFDGEDAPALSCVLPGGHRFECLTGPSVQSGLSLAIRCKHPFRPSWRQIGATEAVASYLCAAATAGRAIVVSGATNSGKTTLLNMLLASIPAERRVIALEDAPELHLDRFSDGNGLLAAREAGGGDGMVGWRRLYDHLVRITPDHVVFGEISTGNAFAALAALNAGIGGFMCTIHADSARQALHRKFEQNIAWAGDRLERVPEYLTGLIDVVVQIERGADGWRRIVEIWEPRNDRYVMRDGTEIAVKRGKAA